MSDNECGQLYEYLLNKLKEWEDYEDIVFMIESLKYENVLNREKVRHKRKDGKKEKSSAADGEQMWLPICGEDESGEIEMCPLTGKEMLLKALEIIQAYAVTIPLMINKTKQNLCVDNGNNICWHTDDNETIDGLDLSELEYLKIEELNENNKILQEIIEEVTSDGINKGY